uniref:IF rod domain-containing protein n=1 Tax=Chelydra serpentina TaxID=8475 RepID=A0A8C3TB59_CHESE
VDLVKALAEIREQYEAVIERNLGYWLRSDEPARVSLPRVPLGRSLQLGSSCLCFQKEALEGTLAETQAGYGGELAQLRGRVARKEAELAQLRTDTQRQAEEHQQLLDLKTRLEMEIATYQRLLEGDDARSGIRSS